MRPIDKKPNNLLAEYTPDPNFWLIIGPLIIVV